MPEFVAGNGEATQRAEVARALGSSAINGKNLARDPACLFARQKQNSRRDMLGQREEYLEAGMDDYVTKPIERPLLFAAIARVLSYTAKTAVAGSSAGDANHPAPAGAGAPDGPHSGAADLSDDAAKTSKRSWTKRGPVSKWSRKSDRMLEQRK